MIKDQTTGLIGLLFDDKYDITKLIRGITDEIQKKITFVPQCYLHTTLIYLGKEYKDEHTTLLNNMNFAHNINRLKGAKCIFSHTQFIGNSLIYVYKFEDRSNEFIIDDLISAHEKYPHSPNFHITMGQVCNNYDKNNFGKIKGKIERMLENTYFYLDQIEIIEADKDKKYNLYKIIA